MSYYTPVDLNGRKIVPFVYVSAALGDYCLESTFEHRPNMVFRSEALKLISHVTQYAERQGLTVAALANPEGLEALQAIADVCAARFLPGAVLDCGDAFNIPWQRVRRDAHTRASEATMSWKGNRFYARSCVRFRSRFRSNASE